MSSEQSTTSSSSRLSQFGLHRTIDARTEEFLKLSKKRQIRQGCACAVISTAITVTIVVVILLIYEYAISVESTLVQKIRSRYFGNNTNETYDRPFADRLLDRSYFGFDQDYYERMPLMVNAMQENSYIDPLLENTPHQPKPKARYIKTNFSKSAHTTATTTGYRYNGIRRTSPRPFHYEYRSPPPAPFSKTYGSRSWVESYRNAQRLKNLQQVIKYLEKTINAKFGDMYVQPTSTHIAFSGIYVEPEIKIKKSTVKPTSPTTEMLQPSSSNTVNDVKSNHKVDPLFSFKPESPGDVNMLADGFLRFSPISSTGLRNKVFTTTPMFRQIKHRNKHCIGLKCYEEFESKIYNIHASGEINNNEILTAETPKAFSVMLNLFPIKSTESSDILSETTPESSSVSLNQIYFTTSRPTIQFRRKSTTPIRRITTRFKRPKVFIPRFIKTVPATNMDLKESKNEPKMIVHVNVYPPIDLPINNSQDVTDSAVSSSTTQSTTYRYVTEMPMLTSTQVEDYHVGSSGIIPVESRWLPSPPPPDPTAPPITTIPPPLPPLTTTEQVERIPSSTETKSWDSLPKVIKFNEEDAKVPDEYQQLLNTEKTNNRQLEISRRNSKDGVELNSNEASGNEKDNIAERRRKLIIKLRNAVSTTEENNNDDTDETALDDNEDEPTTMRTYVPLINGHYRSVNQNKWLTSSESRKRRLEMSITGFRKTTYVPQYTEIKRDNTRNSSDGDESENE